MREAMFYCDGQTSGYKIGKYEGYKEGIYEARKSPEELFMKFKDAMKPLKEFEENIYGKTN